MAIPFFPNKRGLSFILGLFRIIFIFSSIMIATCSDVSFWNLTIIKVLNLILFSLSHGYATTIFMMNSSSIISSEISDIVGNIMVIGMLLGVAIGAVNASTWIPNLVLISG